MNAFDTYRPDLVAAKSKQLKAENIEAVGLYYFQSSEFKQLLTAPLAETICKAGLAIWSIWENGQPNHPAYFTEEQGHTDAARAHNKAARAGQPDGTTIYFAYDYDAAPGDLPRILEYAEAVQSTLTMLGCFTASCYGSGLVCKALSDKLLVARTWLAQSRGWADYAAWKPHAHIVQGPKQQFHGMDIDSDVLKNDDCGTWRI